MRGRNIINQLFLNKKGGCLRARRLIFIVVTDYIIVSKYGDGFELYSHFCKKNGWYTQSLQDYETKFTI